MFDFDDAFGSNETAEIDGVWSSLGDGARVKVARLGNPKAQAAYRRLPPTIKRQLEEGTLGETEIKNFLVKFVANNLLKDFEGIGRKEKSKNDKTKLVEVPYTIDNALILLADRRFRDRIWDLASDDALFNVGDEETVKN